VVSPNNISMDKYIEVNVCYKCYQLDNHRSDSCPKDDGYLICSLCSELGHTFKNCNSSNKKCVNCGNAHNTLSLSCPVRKKIVDEKRREDRNLSYAAKTARPVSASRSSIKSNHMINAEHIGDMREIMSKTSLCLMMAILKMNESGCCFETVLNGLLSENNLPSFSMGAITPPMSTSFIDPATRSTVCPATAQQRNEAPENDIIPPCAGGTPAVIAEDLLVRKVKCAASSGAVNKVKNITIYKKKGTEKISVSNIEKLLYEKRVIIESDNVMFNDCLILLKTDISVGKIIELPVRDFNARMVAVTNSNTSLDRANNVK